MDLLLWISHLESYLGLIFVDSGIPKPYPIILHARALMHVRAHFRWFNFHESMVIRKKKNSEN